LPTQDEQTIPSLIDMLKKVLFVCVENACRSQMAEAFARIHGQNCLEASSAGSRPSGKVNSKAVLAMKDVGYDLSQHDSTSLDAGMSYDLVVTMGCGDSCPYVTAAQTREWQIPDPKDMDMSDFAEVRNMIEQNVLELIEELQCSG
jgi:protein-tyrosine-phosphatase